jgi:hypothetical protein
MNQPLTDDELLELMFLYRVCREGADKPGEAARLAELMKRYDAQRVRGTLADKISDSMGGET